jgi:hypothetical protein
VLDASRFEDIKDEYPRIMRAIRRQERIMGVIRTKRLRRTPGLSRDHLERWRVMWMVVGKVFWLANQATMEPGDEPWRENLRRGLPGVLQRLEENLKPPTCPE